MDDSAREHKAAKVAQRTLVAHFLPVGMSVINGEEGRPIGQPTMAGAFMRQPSTTMLIKMTTSNCCSMPTKLNNQPSGSSGPIQTDASQSNAAAEAQNQNKA